MENIDGASNLIDENRYCLVNRAKNGFANLSPGEFMTFHKLSALNLSRTHMTFQITNNIIGFIHPSNTLLICKSHFKVETSFKSQK